jgi:hypothetical protein
VSQQHILSTSEFGHLRWLADKGGVATIENNVLWVGKEQAKGSSPLIFLRLVSVGAIDGANRELRITEYGRRLISPF